MGRTGRVHALGARADVQYGVARQLLSLAQAPQPRPVSAPGETVRVRAAAALPMMSSASSAVRPAPCKATGSS